EGGGRAAGKQGSEIDRRPREAGCVTRLRVAGAAFGEGDGEAAVAAVVGALAAGGADQSEPRRVQGAGLSEVVAWRVPGLPLADPLEPCAAAEALERILEVNRVAEEDDGVALVLEPLGGDILGPLD